MTGFFWFSSVRLSKCKNNTWSHHGCILILSSSWDILCSVFICWFCLIAGLMKKQKRRKRDVHQAQGKGNMCLLKSCLFIMMIQKWKRTSGSEVRIHALYLFYYVLHFNCHMLVTVLWWLKQELFLQVLVYWAIFLWRDNCLVSANHVLCWIWEMESLPFFVVACWSICDLNY